MFEKFTTIEVAGKQYKLVFSLAAMSKLMERYGSVADVSKAMEDDKIEAVRIVYWLFPLLANQGAWIDAGGDAKKVHLITEEYAGAILMPSDIKPIMTACQEAMRLGMDIEHAYGEGTVVDVTLEELKSKNAEGAEE